MSMPKGSEEGDDVMAEKEGSWGESMRPFISVMASRMRLQSLPVSSDTLPRAPRAFLDRPGHTTNSEVLSMFWGRRAVLGQLQSNFLIEDTQEGSAP